MAFLALVLLPLGETDRATQWIDEAVVQGTAGGHIPTICYASNCKCLFEAINRGADRVNPLASALIAIGREHELPYWLAHGLSLLGWARAHAGDPDGEIQMRQGLTLLRERDMRIFEPPLRTLIAEVEATAGRVDAGLATLDAELARIVGSGERWFEAEMHRVRGELLLKRRPPDEAAAEAAFKCALETARAQRTRTFELRAVLSLARLYHATGRIDEARALLARALAGFRGAPDLPEAGQADRLFAALGQMSRATA
jgi:predicted ATPase